MLLRVLRYGRIALIHPPGWRHDENREISGDLSRPGLLGPMFPLDLGTSAGRQKHVDNTVL